MRCCPTPGRTARRAFPNCGSRRWARAICSSFSIAGWSACSRAATIATSSPTARPSFRFGTAEPMQFFLYLIVGGLSFVVEIGVFVALRRAAMPVIAASVASFLVATLANYLLSILLAFQSGRFRRSAELGRFLAVVLVGLALNTALVWCFAYPLAIQ